MTLLKLMAEIMTEGLKFGVEECDDYGYYYIYSDHSEEAIPPQIIPTSRLLVLLDDIGDKRRGDKVRAERRLLLLDELNKMK